MNIFKKTNEALCLDGCDELNQISIAINHHHAKTNNPWLAVPVKYRFKTDLAHNISRHKAPGYHVEITMTRIDEFGDPTCLNGKEYTSNYCLNRDTSTPSQATNIFISVKDDMVYLTTKGSLKPFSIFPLYPIGDIHEQKFKTKKGCSVVVLSLNHDEINDIIRAEIEELETGMLGNMVKFENGFWKPSTYLSIWSTLSELYTCILLNEQLRDKGSTLVWLPTNMRGEHKNKKIGDMKGKIARWPDGNPRKMRNDNKKNMPLHVQVQLEGADLTLHRLGCERFSKDTWPTLAKLDVKLDHYAATSNRIFVETHVYSEEKGFEKSGWLWKRNDKEKDDNTPIYITYQVDEKLYTFKLEDLVKEVNDEGTPQFEEYTDIHGRTARKVMGRFSVNTADTHCTRTGMGKYGFYITLDRSNALAKRIDDVLPAMLHDVAIRADSYFKIDPEDDYPTTKQKWVHRMVRKSEELKQRGA